jgi:FtsP/CotA-like multicopper oxidase with cupredoxin domain
MDTSAPVPTLSVPGPTSNGGSVTAVVDHSAPAGTDEEPFPNLTRRRFLRGAALAGGGIVAATVAACAPTGATTWTEHPRPSGMALEGPTPAPSSASPIPSAPSASTPAASMDMGSTPAPSAAADDMDAMTEAGIKRFLDTTKQVTIGNRPLEPTIDGDWKVFDLTCAPTRWEVVQGQVVDAVAYNGMVPGPRIRVTEGDRVRAIVRNNLAESTSVHWHGVRVPNKMDGVPFITQPPIKPGETFVYEFVARPFGSQMYHSHHNATDQVGRGMLGAFLIDPKDPKQDPAVDQDIVWISNDQLGGFTINGKQFPDTEPLAAKLGQRIRIRFMNEGIMMHPWHVHGLVMQVIARDGHPLGSAAFSCDTLGVNPGERWDVLIDCDNPGAWAFHCHILPHAEGPHGMYGMVTALIVS